MKSGLLFIISGPAGSGKSTLCNRLLDKFAPQTQRVVTSTTRPPRGKEEHLVDYYFFSKQEFQKRIENNEFYEYATVHNNFYGVLKKEVDDKLAQGIDLLVNIDVQGASTLRNVPELKEKLVSIFILPESIDTLQERMLARAENNHDEINQRLQVAKDEVQQAPLYDHTIHSSSKENDFQAILNIYYQEKKSHTP